MKRIFLFIFLIILSSLIQIGLLNSLDDWGNRINLILCLVVFITIIFNYSSGLWAAFIGGLILDLYSPLTFGIFTLIFLIIAILANFLFTNFFTNKSLYSLLALGGLASILYGLLFYIFVYLLFVSNLSDTYFLLDIVWLKNLMNQIILNSIILILFFIFVNKLSKRLKATFLWID